MTTSTRCMIAQRLHENDPVGHLLKSGDWEQLVIRQEYELEREAPTRSIRRSTAAADVYRLDGPAEDEGALMDPVRFPAENSRREEPDSARAAMRRSINSARRRPTVPS
jgi:hypothetical protein